LEAVCEGADTVFLTAAIVNYWSEYDFEWAPIEAVNVTGTENVIAACKKSSVTRLIGTSSSAVVVPYDLLNNPVEFVDESVPLASAPYLNHYVRSKVATERIILGANGSDLKTMVVRPGGEFFCAVRTGQAKRVDYSSSCFSHPFYSVATSTHMSSQF
jgi:nucleoside-diphosphate-sugar epimerase